jgi:hypothetical protein
MLAALLGDPSRLLKEAVPKGLLSFPAVIAGIMDRCQLLMNRLIDLDPSGLDIFL